MRYYLVNSKEEIVLDLVKTIKDGDKSLIFEFVQRDSKNDSGPNNEANKQRIHVRKMASSYFYSEDGKTWHKLPRPFTAHPTILNKHKEFQLYRGFRPSGASTQNSKGLKTEIPGKVVSIQVKEGDLVTKGQTVLILESMKMENEIKSNRDGIISKICVTPGQILPEGVLMMEIDDPIEVNKP